MSQFVGKLSECRISSFEDISDDRDNGKILYFAVVQEKWGASKWVRLLDPNARNIFPVMREGTATFELAFVESNVIKDDNGRQRAKKEVKVNILCLTDFQPNK